MRILATEFIVFRQFLTPKVDHGYALAPATLGFGVQPLRGKELDRSTSDDTLDEKSLTALGERGPNLHRCNSARAHVDCQQDGLIKARLQ